MNFKTVIKALLFGCILVFFVGSASAQSLYGDFVKPKRDIKRGFYIGSEFGFLMFLNAKGVAPTGQSVNVITNPGFTVSFFTGYDIFDYLSIETRFRAGLNGAWQNDPLSGGIYTFQTNALLRGFYPIGRIFPFIDFGGGFFFTHPDYVGGINKKFNLEIGFGLDYYTYQRHFSIGFRGAYDYIKSLPDALAFNVNMKYTF